MLFKTFTNIYIDFNNKKNYVFYHQLPSEDFLYQTDWFEKNEIKEINHDISSWFHEQGTYEGDFSRLHPMNDC